MSISGKRLSCFEVLYLLWLFVTFFSNSSKYWIKYAAFFAVKWMPLFTVNGSPCRWFYRMVNNPICGPLCRKDLPG